MVIFRFNKLPSSHINNLLNTIVEKEEINISKNSILNIQHLYKSDIRSMINCIQSNQSVIGNINIITPEIELHPKRQ